MSKLIVVCGATGGLGGSVVRRMLGEGWRVRGITRNTESASAKALAETGVELTTANYDDFATLEKAFEGAHAIFGLTNMMEYLLEGTPEAGAEREKQQILNIATAASKIPTLEHYIQHTLPSGEKMANIFVGHLDGKDRAADIIKQTMPDLAKKTTFLWLGMFASNLYKMMRPVEIPGSYGSHIFLSPTSSETKMYNAGDETHNTGVFVSAILCNPQASLPAKVAFIYTEYGTFQDYIQPWIDITGKRTTFLQVSQEDYAKVWGPFGKEIGAMLKAFEIQPDWTVADKGDVITAEDLGIKKEDLVGTRAALEKVKDQL